MNKTTQQERAREYAGCSHKELVSLYRHTLAKNTHTQYLEIYRRIYRNQKNRLGWSKELWKRPTQWCLLKIERKYYSKKK